MTSAEMIRIKRRIDRAFHALAGVRGQGTVGAAAAREADGKVFELFVLSEILKPFVRKGFEVRLVGKGTHLQLRSKPGVVDSNEPHLEIGPPGAAARWAVWSNVQFHGIGFENASRVNPVAPDYHELDIAISPAGISEGYLSRKSVLLGAECKDRELKKGMLREAIGMRRELSMLAGPTDLTEIQDLFFRVMFQDPPSILFLFSSRPLPANYEEISDIYGISVQYLPL